MEEVQIYIRHINYLQYKCIIPKLYTYLLIKIIYLFSAKGKVTHKFNSFPQLSFILSHSTCRCFGPRPISLGYSGRELHQFFKNSLKLQALRNCSNHFTSLLYGAGGAAPWFLETTYLLIVVFVFLSCKGVIRAQG